MRCMNKAGIKRKRIDNTPVSFFAGAQNDTIELSLLFLLIPALFIHLIRTSRQKRPLMEEMYLTVSSQCCRNIRSICPEGAIFLSLRRRCLLAFVIFFRYHYGWCDILHLYIVCFVNLHFYFTCGSYYISTRRSSAS